MAKRKIGKVWVGDKYVHGPRLADPKRFSDFRVKKVGGKKVVLGKLKGTNKWIQQSTLRPTKGRRFMKVKMKRKDGIVQRYKIRVDRPKTYGFTPSSRAKREREQLDREIDLLRELSDEGDETSKGHLKLLEKRKKDMNYSFKPNYAALVKMMRRKNTTSQDIERDVLGNPKFVLVDDRRSDDEIINELIENRSKGKRDLVIYP
jgi:hypothetical protein